LRLIDVAHDFVIIVGVFSFLCHEMDLMLYDDYHEVTAVSLKFAEFSLMFCQRYNFSTPKGESEEKNPLL